jgi:hypothetical protein
MAEVLKKYATSIKLILTLNVRQAYSSAVKPTDDLTICMMTINNVTLM